MPPSTSIAMPPRGSRQRLATLGGAQFVMVLAGLTVLGIILAGLVERQVFDALARRELRPYERTFGFEFGRLKGPQVAPEGTWGFAAVTPGGEMARAGVRPGDVVFSTCTHGCPFEDLSRAINEAINGRTACFDVVNVANVYRTRQVCIERPVSASR